MGRAIGIDFGATSSVVAIADGPAPRVLGNREGSSQTPSVISLGRRQGASGGELEELLVGRAALDNWPRAPQDTVRSLKRLLGREAGVRMGQRDYSPVDLAAMLRQLKEDAEFRLGEEVSSVVLTVPAGLSHYERDATRQAGVKAGMRVLGLVDEAEAAALAADFGSGARPNTILVYDLGGAKCQSSFLRRHDDAFVSESSGAATGVAGDAFDRALLDQAIRDIREDLGIDPTADARFMAQLEKAVRGTKERLSDLPSAELRLTETLGDADGIPIHVELEIHQLEFETLIRPLVEETLNITRGVMRDAGVTPEGVDCVLLMGGSSRVPLVRRSLEGMFGSQKLLRHVHPKDCVALGAAMVAAQLAGVAPVESHAHDITMAQCTPVHYGLQLPGDRFHVLIPKGSLFPADAVRAMTIYTSAADQRILQFPVFGGNNLERASANDLQGNASVALPPGLPPNTPVHVRLGLDGDGLFTLNAHLEDGTDLPPWNLAGSAQPNVVPAGSVARRGHTEMPAALTDRVHFSVTGPPRAAPGTSFVIDIWAHLDVQRAEVESRARQAARGREIFIREKGPVQIARGTVLTVHLRIHDLEVEDPEDTILWEGAVGNASFPVRVPADARAGDKSATATFHASGLQVAKLHFTLAVGQAALAAETLPFTQKRHRTAFASYAGEDRDEVLAIIQGLQKGMPDLDIFLDVARLRSGQRWQEQLWSEIAARDVFYLFWSAAASRSEWVEREWRCAYERRGLDFIDPVPLAPPEIVRPPRELAELHFNDWVLAYKRRAQGPTV
jgi:molecular chaperone DnaK